MRPWFLIDIIFLLKKKRRFVFYIPPSLFSATYLSLPLPTTTYHYLPLHTCNYIFVISYHYRSISSRISTYHYLSISPTLYLSLPANLYLYYLSLPAIISTCQCAIRSWKWENSKYHFSRALAYQIRISDNSKNNIFYFVLATNNAPKIKKWGKKLPIIKKISKMDP